MTRAILFLTPQLPYPPLQGTAIRNWGLISHLARRHTVSLVSFSDSGAPSIPPELRAVCQPLIAVATPHRSRRQRLVTLFRGQADLLRRLWSPVFEHQLSELLRMARFDVVHLEGLEMAPYLATVLAHAPNARVIYDAHNAEHSLQRRAYEADRRHWQRLPAALYSRLQVARLTTLEAAVCRAVDDVVCVSAEDGRALQALVPELSPLVVPNGVNCVDYAAPGAPPAALDYRHVNLVFTGKMDYRPNVDAALWFADAILPRVRLELPSARFVVVGQKPVPALLRRSGRDGLLVTGAVPDVRPYIGHANVYVAPLRMGGGTRFKLLEALALARPVVSTTMGAEGFPVRSGRELILADSAEDIAAAITALLADPLRAAALGRAGRAFVQAGYDWSQLVPRLESLYA